MATNKTSLAPIRRCLKPWMCVGTIILLVSWITQQGLYDHYDSISRDLDIAYQRYSNAYSSSLQYVTMYMLSQKNGDSDPQMLTKAALENMAGFAASLEPLPLTKEKKAMLVLQLGEAASKVRDLDGYNEYISMVNKEEAPLLEMRVELRQLVASRRGIAGWLYSIPYLIGTVLLAVGFWKGE